MTIWTTCDECGDKAPSRIENLYEGRILCAECLLDAKECPNCHQPHNGGHLVPASCGEPSFWICNKPTPTPEADRAE